MNTANLSAAVRVRKARRRSFCALCRSPIATGQQISSSDGRTIDIHEMATGLGMYARDLFLLVPTAPSTVAAGGRWPRQLHARKVHSYLWIFETGGYRRRG